MEHGRVTGLPKKPCHGADGVDDEHAALVDSRNDDESQPRHTGHSGRSSRHLSQSVPRSMNMRQGKYSPQIYRRILAACVITDVAMVAMSLAIILPFFTEEVLTDFPEKGLYRHLVVGIIFATPIAFQCIILPTVANELPKAGGRHILTMSSFLVSGTVLLFAFVSKIRPWAMFVTECIAIRVVQGVGTGANFTAAYAVLLTTFPDSSGLVNGTIRALNALGYSLGPALGGIMYDIGSFGLPLYVVGALLVIVSLINVVVLGAIGESLDAQQRNWYRKHKPGSAEHTTGEGVGRVTVSFRRILSIPWVWACLTLVTAGMFMCGLLESTIAHYMKDTFHVSSSQAGISLLVYAVTLGVTAPLCGTVVDKWIAPQNLFVCSLALAVLSLLLYGPASILPVEPSLALNYFAMIPFGVSSAMILTAAPEEMIRTLDGHGVGNLQEVGTHVAALTQATLSGAYLIGALPGPLLAKVLGLRVLSSIAVFVFILLTVLFALGHCVTWRKARRSEKQRQNAHQPGTVPSTSHIKDLELASMPLYVSECAE
eukprot:scpid51869/ scgid6490/ MFS-type transporter SLC18B1; Solute carrier family 18 member B1